jgi:hypothetical protein
MMSLKGRSCRGVKIRMSDAESLSLQAIVGFLAAGEAVRFEAEDRRQLYHWAERVLADQEYAHQC